MPTPDRTPHFHILACIDGSTESYRGLRYALKFSAKREDTDISLIYVRAGVKMATGGLTHQVARENLMEWDLDMPGLKVLKKARDILVENGFLGEGWDSEEIEKRSRGSRSGNHTLHYTCKKTAQNINLIVREDNSVLTGIKDQVRTEGYDLVIISASKEESAGAGAIDTKTAISVAQEVDCSVLLSRSLEAGKGHLVSMTNSVGAANMLDRDIRIANRCGCPIYLYAVAEGQDGQEEAEAAIALGTRILEEQDMTAAGTKIDIGDPVERIIEEGRKYSLIVISPSRQGWLKSMVFGNATKNILTRAKNSVLIAR